MDISAETLKEILALRKKNGLDATEAAAKADLAGVSKWTLEPTSRYRRAGESPIYLPGKLLTAKGVDPVTGEKEDAIYIGHGKPAPKPATARRKHGWVSSGKQVDETNFYRVLHGKGFQIKMTKDILTEETETKVPAAIEKLALQFGDIPANTEGIYVTQTTPQIQISLPLDKFLEIAGIKP